MVGWALALAAAVNGNVAHPYSVATFDLAEVAASSNEPAAGALPKRSRRSRYLMPNAELPDDDEPGIQIRWKLKSIKLKMPLPSI
jgi:hypothetical protein